MSVESRPPYDAVTYPGSPFSQTHPDRLATIASLYGLAATPPERCRVLELGCGTGAISSRWRTCLPKSTFLGLDAAGSAVAKGQEQIAALGLSNVTLVHADLMDASNLGTFDYVIAHGLYSWVPPAVQERVLAIVAEVLAPNGVAYVSYNALPGCHVRNAMRQMMRWHVRGLEDPAERIAQARGFVRFLAEAAPARPVFSVILTETFEHQAKQPDAVLFHDDLAEFNEAVLFIDFIERASRHRLKFLSEADYCDMAVWNADSPAGRFLLKVGAQSVIQQQQYRDFLIFRRFRQTLLCRAQASAVSEPDPEALRSLYVGASTRPKSGEPDVTSDEPVRFVSEKDGEVTTPHPLSKAAFLELGSIWPRWIAVSDLLAAARARLSAEGGPSAGEEDETRLLGFLLRSYGAHVIHLRSTACPLVTEVSERPRASALARLQARTLTDVTNLAHRAFGSRTRWSGPLVLLDGTRDRATIAREMAAALRAAHPAATALAADVERDRAELRPRLPARAPRRLASRSIIAFPHVGKRANRLTTRSRIPGLPFSQTHPDRLATIAALYGFPAAPPSAAACWRLGCADGGNLIPMAYVLPESTFLGLDAAGSAVARGREQISALGLTNVTLLHADLLDASNLGTFDYVIAHGVYSWVSPYVQERVLAIELPRSRSERRRVRELQHLSGHTTSEMRCAR